MKKNMFRTITILLTTMLMALAAVSCALAQGEGGHSLTVTMADGPVYVNENTIFTINAAGAEKLIVEYNGYSNDLSNYWDWDRASEDGWGVNHEHVRYNIPFSQTGNQTVTFRAYWAEDIVEGEVLPWVVESVTVNVLSEGAAGAPTLSRVSPASGSVTRGEMVGIGIAMGENASHYSYQLYRGESPEGESVYQNYGWTDCVTYIPTWTLEGGTYTLQVENIGTRYTEGVATLSFTIDGTGYTPPTGITWAASKDTIQPGEEVTVGVYVPGGQNIAIHTEMNGELGDGYQYPGESGTITTAFEYSGQPAFIVYQGSRWGQELGRFTGVTVEAGEPLPAPVVTCAEEIPEGSPLEYTIAAGEGADAPEYSGIQYRVILKEPGSSGYMFRTDRVQTGNYSFSWAELSNSFWLRTGDTIVLRVEAHCDGFETSRTEKLIFINGKHRDEDFTISITGEGVDEDGAVRVPVNTSYTLQASGIPDEVGTIEVLNQYGSWDSVNKTQAINGYRGGWYDEAANHKSVLARYTLDGTDYYSNPVFINYYRNGIQPRPQVRFAEGDSPKTVVRGESIRIRVDNADAYEASGSTLRYDFSGNGWVNGGQIQIDGNGLATLKTADLNANESYYIMITAGGKSGISSSYSDDLQIRVEEPSELFFRVDKNTVYPGEDYMISGYVPDAIRTRVVRSSGGIFESEYGNILSMIIRESEQRSITYTLEALYTEPGAGEAETWSAVAVDPVTVTVSQRGSLNELVTVDMPEEIHENSALTFALTSDEINRVDRLAVRVLDEHGNLVFRAEKNQVMTISIPSEMPEAMTEYSDYYSSVPAGESIIKAQKVYRIQVQYTKTGYEMGSTTEVYYVNGTENGSWLTADGTKGPLYKNAGETVTLEMSLPAGTRAVRIMNPTGGWYGIGYSNTSGGTEEYTYDMTCSGIGEGYIVAWYTTEEDPGWEEEDWAKGHYSNPIRISIACTHGETRTEYVWEEGHTCVAADSSEHIHSGRAHMYKECIFCGMRLEDLGEEEVEDVREAHSFHNGQCQVCGYVCLHEHVRREITASYEWADENTHKYIESSPEIYGECPDCDEYLHLEPIYNETIENHTDADNNGICDVCGNSIAGDWSWRIHDNRLLIEGTGAIADFGDEYKAAWYTRRGEIKEIVIPEGITRIGANAFAGLTEPTRITFKGETRPEIDPTAFSGSNLICRYFTEAAQGEENTWSGNFGAASIKWIYLPDDNSLYNTANLWYYENDGYYGTGWWYNNRQVIPVSREQAEELTYMGRNITLYALPSAREDRDMYEEHWDIMTGLSFCPEGSGSCSLTIPASVHNFVLDFDAPGWTLTVDASAANEHAFGMVLVGGGTLNMTAPKISTLFLRGWYSQEEQGTAAGQVTINADVDSVHYYNTDNDQYRFAGTATVNGTITQGFEYGKAIVRIPNLPEIPQGDAIVARFSNVNQTAPIVLNSTLNVEGAETYGVYSEDNCRLYYELTNNNGADWWRLQISPIAGDNAQPIHISDLADVKPDFSMEDIYWGEYTGFNLNCARPGGTTTVTIPEGLECNYLTVTHCNAIINGSIYQMDVDDWREENGPFQVTLNGTVEHFNMRLQHKLCSMTLGQGGYIQSGNLRRPLYDTLYFENVGAGTLMQNSRLTVLSHLANQRISSLPPSEETLSAAAGLGEGEVAVMRITDAVLTDSEEETLSALTGSGGGTADAVFDVSITAYETGSNEQIDTITELNTAVPITVKNITGGEAYVARLHEGENGLEAEKLTEPTAADTIEFLSDKFSKYVLVKTGAEASIIPSSEYTPTGTVTTLPANITRIESEAFAGTKLTEIDIPAGVEIADDAFDGTGLVAIYCHDQETIDYAVRHGYKAIVEPEE